MPRAAFAPNPTSEFRLNKTGKAADLVLRNDNLAIAVEIAITNTVDYEFGNVKKMLGSRISTHRSCIAKS